MQPTYLPWCGYFHLASKVDVFVFLDDVQFERRSWQSRNNILSNGKSHLLVVPVKQAPQQTLIREILIATDTSWKKKHLRTLQVAYPGLWQQSEMRDSLIEVYEKPFENLVDLNIGLINLFFKWLNIGCRVVRASELACGGTRSQHLANICHAVQAETYFSPIGSRNYLVEDKFEQFSGIKLNFSEFLPDVYPQGKNSQFVSHLSVVDVIGYHGPVFAEKYIKKANIHAENNY